MSLFAFRAPSSYRESEPVPSRLTGNFSARDDRGGAVVRPSRRIGTAHDLQSLTQPHQRGKAKMMASNLRGLALSVKSSLVSSVGKRKV